MSYNINYIESFKKLDQAGLSYNKIQHQKKELGKDFNPKLKSGHFFLAMQLIKLYSKQLGTRGGTSKDTLHQFTTNSIGLAKMLKCNERTIQRQLNRLHESMLITKQVKRNITKGAGGKPDIKAYYLITLSLNILHLGQLIDPLAIEQQKRTLDNDQIIETLKEIETAKSESLEEAGASHPKTTKSTSLETLKLLQTIKRNYNNGVKTPDKEEDKSSILRVLKTGNTKDEDKGTKDEGESRKTATQGRWLSHFAQLMLIVNELWAYCELKFYDNLSFVAHSEVQFAKLYFLSKFIFISPKKYADRELELKAALVFRHNYVVKTKGYTPLPSTFFDAKYKYNFNLTVRLLRKAKVAAQEKKKLLSDYQNVISINSLTNKVLLTWKEDPTIKNYKAALLQLAEKDDKLKDVINQFVLEQNKLA